ncbi:unnamed protein product, partial [Prorocentrum cordatum]
GGELALRALAPAACPRTAGGAAAPSLPSQPGTPREVRMRPTDAYYTVHPREEGSAFRMSSAGSSVLLSTLGAAGGSPSPSASMRTTAQSSPAPSGSAAPQPRIGKVDLSAAMRAAGTLPPIREARGSQTAR